MEVNEAGSGEARNPTRARLGERLAMLEARKKALFCNLSRRLVRGIVKRHEESLELLGDHKE
ncbi:MAG: hypothetical protein QXO51_05600 [Halobacteria archaeon]